MMRERIFWLVSRAASKVTRPPFPPPTVRPCRHPYCVITSNISTINIILIPSSPLSRTSSHHHPDQASPRSWGVKLNLSVPLSALIVRLNWKPSRMVFHHPGFTFYDYDYSFIILISSAPDWAGSISCKLEYEVRSAAQKYFDLNKNIFPPQL